MSISCKYSSGVMKKSELKPTRLAISLDRTHGHAIPGRGTAYGSSPRSALSEEKGGNPNTGTRGWLDSPTPHYRLATGLVMEHLKGGDVTMLTHTAQCSAVEMELSQRLLPLFSMLFNNRLSPQHTHTHTHLAEAFALA